MRATSLFVLAAASAALAAPAPAPSEASAANITVPTDVPSDPLKALQALESLGESVSQQVQAELEENLAKTGSGCTLSKLQIRREWGSLSKTQRQSYIKAVRCLMSKSPNTPASKSPGTKSRFDDFIAVHINQTMEIHYTGNFLSWHRYFTWLYEKALREECGYTGSQPYWNWGLTAITGLEKSPIFDGSDSSMSGNGEYIAIKGNITLGVGPNLPPVILPTGSGGGCLTSGPFRDMSVNLGPVNLDTPSGVVSNPAGPQAYNPRCLRRDLTNQINKDFANPAAILRNIINPTDIDTFQNLLQGIPGSGAIGSHAACFSSILTNRPNRRTRWRPLQHGR